MLSFAGVWALIATMGVLAKAASVCPAMSQKNYGSDHCEVIAFAPQEEGSNLMIGTVWVNTLDCNAKFFNVTAQEIAAVWPEVTILKKNGPRMFMTSCVGMDSMAAFQARMSMPLRKLPKRSLLGSEYEAQASLQMTRAEAENWQADALYADGFRSGTLVNRSSVFAWEAGATVFEILDPDGWPYIMQSMSMQVDSHSTVEGLKTLGARLTMLPAGWQYRSRVLDVGVAVRGRNRSNGIVVNVLQDQFQNSYSRYDEHNGVTWWDVKAKPTTTKAASSDTSPAVILHSSLTVSVAVALACTAIW